MSIIQIVFSFLIMALFACGENPIKSHKVFHEHGARCKAFQKAYPEGIEVKGVAHYEYVDINENQKSYNGPIKKKPIRYVQVVALNKQEQIIQCTETDSEGFFKMKLPKSSSTLKIKVLSRIDNNRSNLAVTDLIGINKSTLYSIHSTIVAEQDQDLGEFTAQASRGNLLGGAFFILDIMLFANEQLKEKLHLKSLSHKLVNIFWSYGTSHILTSYDFTKNHIFIQGGDLDNHNRLSGDPDHFDASVIVHEYMHLVENIFGNPDSPAGAHVPGKNLDPRLAWSEGFAHFLQAVVLDRAYYLDSKVAGYFFFDLEKDYCSSLSNCNLAERQGEGNFREIEVSRYLWDLYDSTEDDPINISLKDIWFVVTSKTDGFSDSRFSFQSLGLFNYLLDKRLDIDLSSLKQEHKVSKHRENFAQYISLGDCPEMKMYPSDYIRRQSSFDWLDNNDFYHYYHEEDGPLELSLDYFSLKSYGSETELDLYLYQSPKTKIFTHYGHFSNYALEAEQKDIIARSPSSSDNNASTGEQKTIQVLKLPKGHYLINVRANTQESPVRYRLSTEEGFLCPSNY